MSTFGNRSTNKDKVLTLFFQAEEELYGAHAQPQKPLMKAGASVIESAESGIELSASAQSGSGSTQTGQTGSKVDGPKGQKWTFLKVNDLEPK